MKARAKKPFLSSILDDMSASGMASASAADLESPAERADRLRAEAEHQKQVKALEKWRALFRGAIPPAHSHSFSGRPLSAGGRRGWGGRRVRYSRPAGGHRRGRRSPAIACGATRG